MNNFIRNPLTIWLLRTIKSKIIEYKYRAKKLQIGYMSTIHESTFGMYNIIYDYVSLINVDMDDFTYVANNTSISRTSIGKYTSIGDNCKIGLGKHPSSIYVSTHPIFYSTLNFSKISFSNKKYFNEFDKIMVGNDVWIGTGVIILDGVHVHDGAIIAAGSVVTKDVPPYAIVGGVPAKLIKYRFNQEEINRLLKLKWWDMDIQYLKDNFKKFHNIKNKEILSE